MVLGFNDTSPNSISDSAGPDAPLHGLSPLHLRQFHTESEVNPG